MSTLMHVLQCGVGRILKVQNLKSHGCKNNQRDPHLFVAHIFTRILILLRRGSAPNVVVCMGMEYGFITMATLRNVVHDTVMNKYGGLIFVKKESRIYNLKDIKGKIVTAVSIQL